MLSPGGNRVVASQSGEEIQRTDTYPYGMPYATNTGAEVQPYTFGGKEYDAMHGLNLYDFHARQQDPELGRFLSMDPLAEKYYSISPYVYCAGNPVNRIDPTGLTDYYFYLDDEGNVINYVVVETENDTPNRFFIQDVSANEDTENRKEYEGSYFEMAMIPSSEYSEDDHKPTSSFPFDSQFDIDRNDYVWGAGRAYTDSKLYERWGESMTDNPDANDIISIILTRGKGSSSLSGFKSHSKNASKSKHNKHTNTRSGGDPEKGRYGKSKNQKKGNKNQKHIPPANPNKRPKN